MDIMSCSTAMSSVETSRSFTSLIISHLIKSCTNLSHNPPKQQKDVISWLNIFRKFTEKFWHITATNLKMDNMTWTYQKANQHFSSLTFVILIRFSRKDDSCTFFYILSSLMMNININTFRLNWGFGANRY